MKNYAEQPTHKDWELKGHPAASKLELPVDPDYIPAAPRIELKAMLRRIQENMAWRSNRPGERERRLATKVDVEFVL